MADIEVSTAAAASGINPGTDYLIGVQSGVAKQFPPNGILNAAPSSDDTYTGTVIEGRVNSGGVTQWDAVYLNSSSQWVKADASSDAAAPARGLATTTQLTTVAVNVLVHGVVRNDAWAWTPGQPIYLSETAGALTQTVPVTSGAIVQAVGFALTADIAFFDFNSTYLTNI